MSRRDGAAAARGGPATTGGDAWTCQYCGREFAPASRSREAYELLVGHIRDDCPEVPRAVRARYRTRCAGGHCGR